MRQLRLPQVRCYMGDNEQRWYMWYSGAAAPLPGLQAVAPAAGSVGVLTRCSSGGSGSSNSSTWGIGLAKEPAAQAADASCGVLAKQRAVAAVLHTQT